MKIVLFAVLALISFVGALAGALAMTGNLSAEALTQVISGAPAAEEQHKAEPETDALGPLAQQIKKKENDLKEREQQLEQRESQIAQREQELTQLQKKLEDLQKQVNGGLEDAEKERRARIQTVAQTIEGMKSQKAAESLENMPPEDAAAVLGLVKPKERGKIVEAMKTEAATRVLRILQEPNKM